MALGPLRRNEKVSEAAPLHLTARPASSTITMCRQNLRNEVPVARQLALSCLPNRAGKVNSFLRFSSTLRTSATTDSLHQRRATSPQPRTRRAFTRRGPCVPSRSALRPSHALHQVRKQGCPSSPARSSPKGGSRQEIADIPRFAAPPGNAHRARGSLISLLVNMPGANPALIRRHVPCRYCAGFNRSLRRIRRGNRSR